MARGWSADYNGSSLFVFRHCRHVHLPWRHCPLCDVNNNALFAFLHVCFMESPFVLSRGSRLIYCRRKLDGANSSRISPESLFWVCKQTFYTRKNCNDFLVLWDFNPVLRVFLRGSSSRFFP